MQNQKNWGTDPRYLVFGFVMFVALSRVLYHGMSVPGEMFSILIAWGVSGCMILGLLFFMGRLGHSEQQHLDSAVVE